MRPWTSILAIGATMNHPLVAVATLLLGTSGCLTSSEGPPADGGIRDADRDADTRRSDSGTADGGVGNAGCRAESECGGGESCYPPGITFRGCGSPCEGVSRACESERDCDVDQVCLGYFLGCCFNASDESTRCVPRCTETSCADGERCGSDGKCEPTPCSDGYTCPAHTQCTSGAGGDGHGCVRDSCSADGDCSDGFCVTGACYESLGSCRANTAA